MRFQPKTNIEKYATPSLFRSSRILGFTLNFLLHQEGRGGQVRLAVSQKIDRGYLNAVIKGRKPAAEEGRTPTPAEAKAVFPDQEDVRIHAAEAVRENKKGISRELFR